MPFAFATPPPEDDIFSFRQAARLSPLLPRHYRHAIELKPDATSFSSITQSFADGQTYADYEPPLLPLNTPAPPPLAGRRHYAITPLIFAAIFAILR
jgi:hypothetical protein